ncbi:iron ABC transporter permease, partial [Escherichia coli]|nr:iron ABC transporter permease [Escherichia coli]
MSIALGIGLAGFALVPWYRIESGFYGLGWLGKFPSGAAEAPGLVQIASHGRWSLAVIALLFALGLAARVFKVSPLRANLLIGAGAAGIVFLVLQGLAI